METQSSLCKIAHQIRSGKDNDNDTGTTDLDLMEPKEFVPAFPA